MTVRHGRATAGALRRALDRALNAIGELDVNGPWTLVAGAEDPMLPGPDAERPLVVVPALGPQRPSPWASALVAAADAVVLFDACEVSDLHDVLNDRPVLIVGLPTPADAPEGRGLQVGGAAGPDHVAAWREHGGSWSGGPGVAWVGGRGASAAAEALEAWAAGRAVVALPGTPSHDLLRRGGALHAETTLELVEATTYLTSTPPLARVLGSRGRDVARQQPSPQTVALRILEGVEVARQSWGPAP